MNMGAESNLGISMSLRSNLVDEFSKVVASSMGLTDITKQVIDLMLKEGTTGDGLTQALSSVAASTQQVKDAMSAYGIVVVSQSETNNEYYKALFQNLETESSTRARALADAKAYFQDSVELQKAQEEANNEYCKQMFANMEEENSARQASLSDAKAYYQTLVELEQQQEEADNAYYTQLFQNMETSGAERKKTMQDAIVAFNMEAESQTGARTSGLAFLMAAREITSAVQQMSAATGETNHNLTQFSDVAREVGAGAMMGSMVPGAGAAGMAIGALSGLLLGLGIAASTVDPQLQVLNKDLDNLAKKDDSAQALAKLAGVSETTARAAMDYGKAHADAADQLKESTHAAENSIVVLQGVGDALSIVGNVWGTVSNKIIAGAMDMLTVYGRIPISVDAIGTAFGHLEVGAVALAQAMAQGKNVVEMLQAQKDAVEKYDNAQKQLNTDVEKFGAAGMDETKLKNFADSFASIAKHDDVVDFLAKVTNNSVAMSDAVVKAANSNKELAGNMATAITRYKDATVALDMARKSGVDVEQAEKELGIATNSLTVYFNGLKVAIPDKELDAAAKAMLNLSDAAAKASDDYKQNYADAVNQSNLQSAQSTRNYTQETAKLYRTLNEDLANLGFQRNQQAAQQARDRETITRTESESEASAAQSLSDRQSDIWVSYNDKLTDLNYSTSAKIDGYWHTLANNQETYNDSVYKSARSLADSLSDESYSKSEALAKATTQKQIDEINRKYEHETYVNDRTYQEKLADASDTLSTAATETNYKISLANEELAHSIEVAQRESDEQVAQAQRSDREAVASAQQRSRDEISDWLFKVQQQNATDIQQAAQIKQRYKDQSADAATRWKNEESDIASRFNLEDKGLKSATKAYSDYAQGVIDWNRQIRNSIPSVSLGIASATEGRASGGSVMGGTTYVVGEEGPELLHLPAGTSGNITPNKELGGGASTLQVNVSMDGANIYTEMDFYAIAYKASKDAIDAYNTGRL